MCKFSDNDVVIQEAPRKPPRTQTTDADLCKSSSDYVCVDIDPVSLSLSHEILGSDVRILQCLHALDCILIL